MDDVVWQADTIWRGIALIHPDGDDSGVPDEELVGSTKRCGVLWASGESDSETIRDYDSGPKEYGGTFGIRVLTGSRTV